MHIRETLGTSHYQKCLCIFGYNLCNFAYLQSLKGLKMQSKNTIQSYITIICAAINHQVHLSCCDQPYAEAVTMFSIQSKWRYLFMFLGVQLVVMALLSREGYQKRVNYFIRIFRKPESPRNHTAGAISSGGDVYANLSALGKAHHKGEDMPFCPKISPFIGEQCCTMFILI